MRKIWNFIVSLFAAQTKQCICGGIMIERFHVVEDYFECQKCEREELI